MTAEGEIGGNLLPTPGAPPPTVRGDAARNRARLLDAARVLIAEQGADAVTMDAVAAAAGVGKGTVFRRFGSRAGLMQVLLDEDEQASQQAFLFGPPPLGPAADPMQRLLAFGGERIRFAHRHRDLLSEANRDPRTRFNAPATLLRRHLRVLLAGAGCPAGTGCDTAADALFALFDADYVAHRLTEGGRTLDDQAADWAVVAARLCGR